MPDNYNLALESFLSSFQFKKALVENSVTDWDQSGVGMKIDVPDGSGGYRLALFQNGTWQLLPKNNPMTPKDAIILDLFSLDDSSLNNCMNYENATEREFFSKQFALEEQNQANILRAALKKKSDKIGIIASDKE